MPKYVILTKNPLNVEEAGYRAWEGGIVALKYASPNPLSLLLGRETTQYRVRVSRSRREGLLRFN